MKRVIDEVRNVNPSTADEFKSHQENQMWSIASPSLDDIAPFCSTPTFTLWSMIPCSSGQMLFRWAGMADDVIPHTRGRVTILFSN
jgi:hypothetical protein